MSVPRLLYFGDVPVEPTMAGAAVLYRLFDGYPADRLVIWQSSLAAVRAPDRRLRGVAYHEFSFGSKRLMHSRAAGYYNALVLARAELTRIADAAVSSRPDAIVTVAHGHGWLAAAALARRHRIPLHLIVHDDCLTTLNVAPSLRGFAESRFRRVYRDAATRFCISPEMRDEYLRLYGVTSHVLYPSKARDSREWRSPSSRTSMQASPFTVTFAGSLNVGHLPAVEALAGALDELGGRLEIYGPEPAVEVRSRLTSQVINFLPYVPANELADRLRERSDLLWLPLSFAKEDGCNMRVCFPSKLTDYTIGVPILISGPADSAAVRWGIEHSGAAEVITGSSREEFSIVLRRLINDPARRSSLAAEALRVGSTVFAQQRTQDQFVKAIVSATQA